MKTKILRGTVVSLLLFNFLILPLFFVSAYTILFALVLVFFLDGCFRLVVRLKTKHAYYTPVASKFEELFVTSHPYLPWKIKANHILNNKQPLNYPLHQNEFSDPITRTNSFGFTDGPLGNRDISVAKKHNEIRVACIGASTTGNYIESKEGIFSYPSELEKLLKERISPEISVINCGIGGINSAELLILFELQVIDYDLDYLVIYHAYNDIRSYLTPNFQSDYSHSRQSLTEAYWKIYLSEVLPTFGLKFLSYIKRRYLSGNIRVSLLDLVGRGTVDFSINPDKGLQSYQRNLQSIIDIAKARNIKIILSTYCHFLYPAIENSEVHLRYQKIVKRENKIMRNLAENNSLSIVDAENLFPYDEIYFVDSVHFTPKGMRKLAEIISPSLEKLLLKDNS